MTEDELLTGIIDALHFGGYLVHHIRRSDKAQQMGTGGFPDIIAVKDGRLLVIECKAAKGRVEPLQELWLDAFGRAGVRALIVRPDDYDAIIEEVVGHRLVKP